MLYFRKAPKKNQQHLPCAKKKNFACLPDRIIFWRIGAIYKWFISGIFPANWGIIWYRSHLLREPGFTPLKNETPFETTKVWTVDKSNRISFYQEVFSYPWRIPMGRLYIYQHVDIVDELLMVNVGKYAIFHGSYAIQPHKPKSLLITSNPQELLFVGPGAMPKMSGWFFWGQNMGLGMGVRDGWFFLKPFCRHLKKNSDRKRQNNMAHWSVVMLWVVKLTVFLGHSRGSVPTCFPPLQKVPRV